MRGVIRSIVVFAAAWTTAFPALAQGPGAKRMPGGREQTMVASIDGADVGQIVNPMALSRKLQLPAGGRTGVPVARSGSVSFTLNSSGGTQVRTWHTLTASGRTNAPRKDMTIKVLDAGGTPVVTYILRNAWLSSYSVVGIRSKRGKVTEKLTVSYESIERR